MGRGSVRRSAAVWLAGAALALTACGQDDKPAPAPSAPPAPGLPAPAAPGAGVPQQTPAAPAAGPAPSAGDPARGRQVWMANCVACHNPDPARDGTLGPAVKGASPALLEARLLRAEYPPGYKAKRETKVMPPRPDLAPAISDLAAYLR